MQMSICEYYGPLITFMNITNKWTFVSPPRICRFCIHVHSQAAGSRVTLTLTLAWGPIPCFFSRCPAIDLTGLLWKPINGLIQINGSLHPWCFVGWSRTGLALPLLWAILGWWDFSEAVTIHHHARLHMMSFSVYTNDRASRVAKINNVKRY